MAERLYGEFKSDKGHLYRIGIWDTDYSDPATEVPIVSGFKLDIDTPSRAFSEAIAAGTLEFTILIRDAGETFKTDIVSSSDTRFSVQVDRDGDPYWCGALVPDIGEIKDEGPEYEMNLKAVCGLGLLEDYEYIDETPTGSDSKWTNTFTGFDRLINIVAICLKKLPHVQTHFTGSMDFIRTGINWYHSGQPYDDPDNTNDPLYNCYVLNSNFSGIQTSGNAKPLSCLQVIEAILTAFNARIMQVYGKWVIEQYETRTNLTDNRVRAYTYDIDPPTLSGFDNANTAIDPRLRGGSFGYAKALKQCIVTLDAKTRYNLTEAMRFDEASASDYNAGNVFWDGTASTFRAKGTIAGNFENISLPSIFFAVNVTLVFRLKVNLQGNYLAQTLSYSGNIINPVVSTMVWSGSVSYVEIPIDIAVAPAIGDNKDFSQEFDFTISTPTGTQGNLSVFFELDRVINRSTGATISGTNYGFNGWDLTNPYFAIYYDEDLPIGKQTFQIINNDFLNQGTLKISTIVGDAVGLNDRGAIRYLDSGNYLATLDWSVRDSVDGFFISNLLGRRILQAQSTTRRTINTTLYGSTFASFDTALTYEGITYFFMGGTFDARNDHLQGRWMELNYDTIDMSTAVNGDTDTSNYNPPATGSGTVNQNNGTGQAGGDGNGIYSGSGTVPAAVTATVSSSFNMTRSGASAGDEIGFLVDDGTDQNQVKVEAGTGVRIVSSGDIITFEGETSFADVISASTINANQNDYSALSGANVGRLTASAAYNITGIAGGTDGRLLVLHNVGSNNITLTNQGSGSAAANRFDIGEEFALRASHCAIAQYDGTTQRWRIIADRLGRWSEAYTTSTATTASLSATSPATNINAAIVPKGTGAFILAIPDGSSTGGNARGTRAVDLQTERNSASQVASGANSGIFAGRRNIASGKYATVLGGNANMASAEGACSVGGQLNTASALYAANVCGVGNTASGTGSATVGGSTNTASTDYSAITGGAEAVASLYSQRAHAAGKFTANGDAQHSELVIRRRITGTGQAELFLDGASIQAILPATNRVWNFRVDVVGVCDTAGNGVGITAGEVWASWHSGAIKRVGTTTSLVGTVQNIATAQADTGMATTVVTVDADDSTEALRVQITPPTTAGTTTVSRWVATIYLTEIGY